MYPLPRTFLCYDVAGFLSSPETPAVSPGPREASGYITFGSFNNLAKVHPRCFGMSQWLRGEILLLRGGMNLFPSP